MPIWEGAVAVQFVRSGDGNTASVLGADGTVLATCDDAGTVTNADGATLMTGAFSGAPGVHSDAPGADLKRLRARVEVARPDGVPLGTLGIKKYSVTPFSKKVAIAIVDPGGTEVGDLSATDRKGRELVVSFGGSNVAGLELAERDRGLSRSVERWTLSVETRPPAGADLLVAAAVLRYGKMIAAVSSPS